MDGEDVFGVKIASSTFYGMLGDAQRQRLHARGAQRSYKQGYIMTAQGQSADRVIVVMRGFAAASCTVGDGTKVLLRLYVPGDVIGVEAIPGQDGLPDSVLALANASVLVIPAAQFTELLETAEVARAFALAMGQRVRDTDELARIRLAPAKARLAPLLLHFAQRTGSAGDANGLTIPVELPQDKLAMWTAASRATVTRALGDLRRREAIRTGYREITITSPARLREIAASYRNDPAGKARKTPPTDHPPPAAPRPPEAAPGLAGSTRLGNPATWPTCSDLSPETPCTAPKRPGGEHVAGVLREHRVGNAAPVRPTGHRARGSSPSADWLSLREREIAALVTDGLGNKEIASELLISPATVARHVANIMSKLKFRTRAQIATWVVGTTVTPRKQPSDGAGYPVTPGASPMRDDGRPGTPADSHPEAAQIERIRGKLHRSVDRTGDILAALDGGAHGKQVPQAGLRDARTLPAEAHTAQQRSTAPGYLGSFIQAARFKGFLLE
jgi:CRP-like cAMP-binding protein/DNA-binding CsgD family transcriptional regulator